MNLAIHEAKRAQLIEDGRHVNPPAVLHAPLELIAQSQFDLTFDRPRELGSAGSKAPPWLGRRAAAL